MRAERSGAYDRTTVQARRLHHPYREDGSADYGEDANQSRAAVLGTALGMNINCDQTGMPVTGADAEGETQ